MRRNVAIIDYHLCNVDSVARAVEECGGQPVITDDAADLQTAERMILPGVGAFPDAMKNLAADGLDAAIRDQVARGIPMLGICLGMQLLASRGFEMGVTPGLDLIPGDVLKLTSAPRIPHIGWNEVHPQNGDELLTGIPPGSDFYFVHSYYFSCANPSDVLAFTDYGLTFPSVIRHGHVMGTQFHPEKSQRTGFRLIKNFLSVSSTV